MSEEGLTMVTYAPVPRAWRALGYSGLFYIEVAIAPGDEQAVRARVPRFLAEPGWICVAVTEDHRAVVVRKDAAAIADLLLRPRSYPLVPPRLTLVD